MSEKSTGKPTTLAVTALLIDQAFQMRAGGLNSDHVDDLVAALAANDQLPRVKVWLVAGIGHVVTDGFHTVEAHKRAKKGMVPCTVWKGTRQEALLAAAMANREHDRSGLKRTNADKRRAVESILPHLEDWGDRLIAKHVGVSHSLVGDVRRKQSNVRELDLESSSPSSEHFREGADGKVRGLKHRAPDAPPVNEDVLEEPVTLPSPPPSARNVPRPGDAVVVRPPVVDWRGIDSHIGPIVRGLDVLWTAHNIKPSSAYRQMEQLLNEFLELWQQARKEFDKPQSATRS